MDSENESAEEHYGDRVRLSDLDVRIERETDGAGKANVCLCAYNHGSHLISGERHVLGE